MERYRSRAINRLWKTEIQRPRPEQSFEVVANYKSDTVITMVTLILKGSVLVRVPAENQICLEGLNEDTFYRSVGDKQSL